jgi:phospholipid-translocating ATPase
VSPRIPYFDTLLIFSPIAIGYSTNLIGPDSNLIAIRGGGYGEPRSAYDQMKKAVEQIFPEDNIMNLDAVQPPVVHTTLDEPVSPRPGLQRTATGLSDILGDENGDKPGGAVLVIDGTALEHVSIFFFFCRSTHSITCRH